MLFFCARKKQKNRRGKTNGPSDRRPKLAFLGIPGKRSVAGADKAGTHGVTPEQPDLLGETLHTAHAFRHRGSSPVAFEASVTPPAHPLPCLIFQHTLPSACLPSSTQTHSEAANGDSALCLFHLYVASPHSVPVSQTPLTHPPPTPLPLPVSSRPRWQRWRRLGTA